MKIVAIANQKGGTGKTTTAIALTQAAASCGKKTLVIDLDAQANATFFLAGSTAGGNSLDLLNGKPAAELIQTTPSGIDLISASWGLFGESSGKGSARRLSAALEPIKGKYDLIVIDTPPTPGELQFNALQSATDLIIPLQADIASLQGLYLIADTAKQIQQSNPGLRITGYILTRHNARSTLVKQMADAIANKASELDIPFLGAIREAVAIKEAQTLQQSLYEYAPKSKPAEDYMAIYNSLK